MKVKNITLVRLVIVELWPKDTAILTKLGEANDTNFHKLLRDGVRSDRINQHFSGANTVSNDSMNEYLDGIEALSAYRDDDPVERYYGRHANRLAGRKAMKVKLFGSSGDHKSGRAVQGTDGERTLGWLTDSES